MTSSPNIVSRTCTELRDQEQGDRPVSRPLSEFRERRAYVLLGDPGMGKTMAFKEEAGVCGEGALLVSARDFITFDPDDHPEWRDRTLFIDGLDEVRAGQADMRSPFDRIRRNLDKLGKRRFRLSCRHADWLATDRSSLTAVSSTGEVAVLRLDPLDEAAIKELLHVDSAVQDGTAFIDQARERGLDAILANPQTLTMLAQAVHGGAWPESRTEIFEQACRNMAAEHNDEHLSTRPLADPEQILDVAGRLFAALLLSGGAGFSRSGPTTNDDYPHLTACGLGDAECRQAMASKLFAYAQEGRAEPVHRHVAEYVAARYLAALIDDGLPAGRIPALMAGADGTVVSQLRGLSAWLAAHSAYARRELIERDPIGVGLYGDIHSFPIDDKRVLLASLSRVPRRLQPVYRTAPAFAALAAPAMEEAFREILRSTQRGDDQQLIADFVLQVLRQGSPLRGFSQLLLEVIRDDTRWPHVKDSALAAFIHCSRDSQHTTFELKKLLEDVHAGRIADPHDDLLGLLLSTLYPDKISPKDIWNYFKESDEFYMGAYWKFWSDDILSRSSCRHVIGLLDACSRLQDIEQFSSGSMKCCVERLLARGLRICGDNIATSRLYDWLDLGVHLHIGRYPSDEMNDIRQWIEERPGQQCDIFQEGIGRYRPDFRHALYEVEKRFFCAELSPELYRSCIHMARSLSQMEPKLAESLLWYVVGSGRFTPQTIQELLGTDEVLSQILRQLLIPPSPSSDLRQLRQREQDYIETQRRSEQEFIEHLFSNKQALCANRASPALLNKLASDYFEDFNDFTPEQGTKNLEKVLQSKDDLLEAVLKGFRLTIERPDVPGPDKVLDLRRESKMHCLCLPFLAGLAEAEKDGSLNSPWWTDERMRKALAIFFTSAHGVYDPAWYRYLIQEHPAVVADEQIRFAGTFLRGQIENPEPNLWHLAYDPSHDQVARMSSLPLLQRFPARCNQRFLATLDYLLLAAYRHADRAGFVQLIERKLSRKSMTPKQRAHWLAAGCALAPDQYEQSAEAFVQGGRSEERAMHLANFFCLENGTEFLFEKYDIPLRALLIRLVGRHIGPDEFRSGMVPPARPPSNLVERCIQSLAENPHPQASDALDRLLADSLLSQWRYSLSCAADDQRVNRRDSGYRHPTVEEVRQTLAGGTPSNAGDLAALVLDRLQHIASCIRLGNTNDWRQYWNEDSHRRAGSPKHEESCRDALLSDLRTLLPAGVDAQPEGRYAQDTRADMRITYQGFNVPVEVKRNQHRQLWSSLQDQLIAKYATDFDTGGHGIYLVLWFGRERTQLPPEGRRPATPNDLKERLEATLSPQQRRKIAICVIDVSQAAPSASQ